MELRSELLPNASEERILMIRKKIEEIEACLHNKEKSKELIQLFNRETGRNYDMEYFQNYWKAEDIEDFALHAAQPVPQKVTDITKEELVEVVQRISNADENVHFYLELLDQNLPHPRISNLIYWPNEEGLSDDVTAEQIVEIAMQYKPMQL